MLYWNPEAPETQFFFNDRDPETGQVFCVLFDIARGAAGGRVKEYRFPDVSIGNSGVAQRGGSFLALNYGRLSRLRPVTGYPDAHDWTRGVNHPEDDGLFRVDAHTGEKQLLVSYRRIADQLRESHPAIDDQALFLNHTLWNRDDDRIFFYARADFEAEKSKRLDALFVVNPDGSGLRRLPLHLGGHLEWESGHRLIGLRGDRIALYDTDRLDFVADLGTPALLGDANGDKALAPGGDWLVNGFRVGRLNTYALLRRSDGTCLRSRGFDQHGWLGGPLRVDPAPCWNRDGTQVLFSSIAEDAAGTRQLFTITLVGVGAGDRARSAFAVLHSVGSRNSLRKRTWACCEYRLCSRRSKPCPSPLNRTYHTGTPLRRTAVTIRSASSTFTRGSFSPWMTRSGLLICAAFASGEIARRNCRVSGSRHRRTRPASPRPRTQALPRGRSRGWRSPRYRSPPGADGCSASGRQGSCSRRKSHP